MLRLIAGFGYRLVWHLPSLFNPNNLYGDDEDRYPGIASIAATALLFHFSLGNS